MASSPCVPTGGLQAEADPCPNTGLGSCCGSRCSWGSVLIALCDPLLKHRKVLDLAQGFLHCSLLCWGSLLLWPCCTIWKLSFITWLMAAFNFCQYLFSPSANLPSVCMSSKGDCCWSLAVGCAWGRHCSKGIFHMLWGCMLHKGGLLSQCERFVR